MSPQDISAAFLSARRKGLALDSYPGIVPTSLEAAYRVQKISIRNWGEPVLGYKVGGIGLQWRDQYPSPWLAGPVFPSVLYVAEQDRVLEVPVFMGGFAAYEPELIFRLRNLDAPREMISSLDEAKSYIADIHLGAEIASSPLATLNELGPGSIISDFGNQAGVVIGQQIEHGWIDRLSDIEVETIIDGELVGRSRVNDGDTGPLGALRFLLNHLRDDPSFAPMDSDIWLSSGAITGVHQASVGSICDVRYKNLGHIRITMTARDMEHSA